MTHLLHVNASARGDASRSLELATRFIGAGAPYPLKHLIDVITQPGWAFAFDLETGYLLQGKRAFVVYTSGVCAEGLPPSFGADFTTSFFRDWLGFVGIDDFEEVHFAPTVVNPDVEASRRVALAATIEAAQRFARAERFAP